LKLTRKPRKTANISVFISSWMQ